MKNEKPVQRLSVIVPENPFAKSILKDKHCLSAFDVDDLMDLWPGKAHFPNRNAEKVKSIQRSLDWKRVADIAAYLLQDEIDEASSRLDKYFSDIYEPKKSEPGREWPPKVKKVVGFQPSEVPTFSNVLIHVNGAKLKLLDIDGKPDGGVSGGSRAGDLLFEKGDPKLDFSVIDGQHRINGAYFALCILRETSPGERWQIPAEIFLDLDPKGGPPSKQAQIFIDVNFNQRKVDRSLVADLFPTARAFRETLGNKERAQDIGRRLMLESGPLVGMVQIPGIRYGVKDVITLATLNGAVENILDVLQSQEITNLDGQTEFIAQCLTSWLEASGRIEAKTKVKSKTQSDIDPQNVVYQGRILVSVIALIPAMLWRLREENIKFQSEKALTFLTKWLRDVTRRANMLENGIFINKDKFKKRGYLGSGGIGRFRDTLMAVVVGRRKITPSMSQEQIATLARESQDKVWSELGL